MSSIASASSSGFPIPSIISNADEKLKIEATLSSLLSGAALPLTAELLSSESRVLTRSLNDPSKVKSLNDFIFFLNDFNPVLGTRYTELPQVQAMGKEDLSLNIFSILEVLSTMVKNAKDLAWTLVQKPSSPAKKALAAPSINLSQRVWRMFAVIVRESGPEVPVVTGLVPSSFEGMSIREIVCRSFFALSSILREIQGTPGGDEKAAMKIISSPTVRLLSAVLMAWQGLLYSSLVSISVSNCFLPHLQ
jgi:hypothetical protein